MKRGPLLAALVIAAALPGCFGGDTGPAEPGDPSPSDAAAIIHVAQPLDASATPVPTDEWLERVGPVPVPDWRPIGYRGFEPTMGVHDGAFFVAAYGPERRSSPGWVLKSTDSNTWSDVTHRVQGQHLPVTTTDPYIHVGDAGRVFNLHMYGAYGGQCHWLETTDDYGISWDTKPASCPRGSPINDHPTLWTSRGDDEHVFLCGNGQLYTACAVSEDGGENWGPFQVIPWDVQPAWSTVQGGHTGHGISALDGTAYIASGGALVNRQPHVARSTDGGGSWEVFRIHDGQVYVTPSEFGAISAHDVEVAVDEQGRLYAFWLTEGRDVAMAVSMDRGVSWSEPVRVSAPGIETSSYIAAVGGTAGYVAVTYYGTLRDVDYHQLTNDDTWGAYLGIIVLDEDQAIVATVATNRTGDPVARGPCEPHRGELDGGRCHGVGDFVDLVLDHDGRPWGVYVDVCSGPCVWDSSARPGNSLSIGTLAQGPSLGGERLAPLSPWPAPDFLHSFNALGATVSDAQLPDLARIGSFPVPGSPVYVDLWWNATLETRLSIWDSSNHRMETAASSSGHHRLAAPLVEGLHDVYVSSSLMADDITVDVKAVYERREH